MDFLAFDFAPQETFDPLRNSEAGPADTVVSAYNGDIDQRTRVFVGGFSLKRASTWDRMNATPQAGDQGAGDHSEGVAAGGRLGQPPLRRLYQPDRGRRVPHTDRDLHHVQIGQDRRGRLGEHQRGGSPRRVLALLLWPQQHRRRGD
jgi:hypothetical protein